MSEGQIDNIIFTQARRGTPYNPGVPDALASLMVAQAKHETAGYTSNFFLNDNNAFGYSYYAGSPYQLGAGGIADNGQPIARYSSVQNSTMEIVDWLYRRYREGRFPDLKSITTPEQYAAALDAVDYFGEQSGNRDYTVYLAGLKRYFKPIAAGLGIVLIVVASAALIYAWSRGSI